MDGPRYGAVKGQQDEASLLPTLFAVTCRQKDPDPLDLQPIERFWGRLKRSAIQNDYFETVENLKGAILKAVNSLNRNKNHPFRIHLKTVQSLPRAASLCYKSLGSPNRDVEVVPSDLDLPPPVKPLVMSFRRHS